MRPDELVLAMEPGAADVLLSQRAADPQSVHIMGEERDVNEDYPVIRSGVAVIPISGTIQQRSDLWERYGFATSVDTLRRKLAAALNDRGVHSILWHVNSPGGFIPGVSQLADDVYAASQVKPNWVYSDESCYSAAYWAMCGATRIIVPATGGVGSLGVVQVLWDTSQAWEEFGIRVIRIATGKYKGIGTNGMPITDADQEKFRSYIERFAEVFRAQLERRAALDVEARFDGSLFFGQEAVDAGLADAVMSIDDVVDAMDDLGSTGGVNKAAASQKQGRHAMPSSKKRRMARAGARGAPSLVAGVGGATTAVVPGQGTPGAAVLTPPASPSIGASTAQGTNGARKGGRPQATTASGGGKKKGGRRAEEEEDDGCAEEEEEDGGEDEETAEEEARQRAADARAAVTEVTGQPGGQQAAQPAANPEARYTEQDLQAAADAALRRRDDRERALDNTVSQLRAAFGDVPGADEIFGQVRSQDDIEWARCQLLARAVDHHAPTHAFAGSIHVGDDGRTRELNAMALSVMAGAMPELIENLNGRGSNAKESGRVYQPQVEQALGVMGMNSVEDLRVGIRNARADFGGHGLRDLVTRCHHNPNGKAYHEIVAESFSHGSSDFPLLWGDVLNKILLMGFTSAPITWDQWCQQLSATDFRPLRIYRASEISELKQILEGQNPEDATFAEKGEEASLKTWGRNFSVSRNMLINDDLNVLTRIPVWFARATGRVADRLAYAAIASGKTQVMSDNVVFFHASRGNLVAGNPALSMASLETAIQLLEDQKDFGNPEADIEIEVNALLVSKQNKYLARRLAIADYDPTPSNTNSLVPNVLKGSFNPVDSARMKSAFGDSDHWVVTGNKEVAPPVAVLFLNGNRSPIVSPITNGSRLGAKWEVIFDCEAALHSPEGAVLSTGAGS